MVVISCCLIQLEIYILMSVFSTLKYFAVGPLMFKEISLIRILLF